MRIALATCKALPEPDADQSVVSEALARHGAEADLCVWNDPAIDWASYALCLLRTPWDYYRTPDAFLAWLVHVNSVTRLQNPLRTVRWNVHKSYLVDLAREGFDVVPTHLERVGATTRLRDIREEYGWDEVVVKPAVSASSYETHRFGPDQVEEGERQLERLVQRTDVLVQQYLSSVHASGERALVFIGGALTHAVRKRPRFHGDDESIAGPLDIEPDEERLARALMQGPGRDTLYGRVDLARDARGQPCLMELELIEPSLFLKEHPPALERYVDVILRAAG